MRLLVYAILLVSSAWLVTQRSQCSTRREERMTRSRMESARLKSHLTGCPIDRPGCTVLPVRLPADGGAEVFHGDDSLFCRAIERVTAPLGLFAMAAGDQSLVLSVPLEEEGARWFAEQCDCRWLRSLPSWMTSWSAQRPGLKKGLRIGERVTNVTAEEVLARVREDELFFGVRGEQFVRWVNDGAGAPSSFYNEAFVRVTEARRIGVVARNVMARRRIVPGILSNTMLFDLVMNEVELSTWSIDGCDCVPDDRSLDWVTSLAMDHVRQSVPPDQDAQGAIVL